MTTIANKTILLTGASRGIGAHIARTLAKEKANIIGVARSAETLKRVCAEIVAIGGTAVPIPFDLRQIEKISDLIEKCALLKELTSFDYSQIEKLSDFMEKPTPLVGSIDILINNAGIEIYRAFPDYSLAELQSVLSINLLAAMELTRLLLPSMLARNSGHIVNIASLAGKKGHPYDSVYSASKAGLITWSDALRQELADTGIGVTTLCPGYVENKGLLADTGIPAPRWTGTCQPEAVAKAVVRAIAQNQSEVIVNGSSIMTGATKLLLASEQLFPSIKGSVNRGLGVRKLNQQRISDR